ncbi:hypothetical protein BAU15_03555 [Enterococcus sp. JM4C]|uniref:hypothetical protein n=1 Tax=Candidatus Enterococcus huntleyi TaxID=1857217 RepID=UPI00137B8E7D|nr:hypothetical protein [Enterococcus sp. JM4C]KAF1295628.1 hypothetical protein BAU15_03555 [Enterococcus sp. JM4C]
MNNLHKKRTAIGLLFVFICIGLVYSFVGKQTSDAEKDIVENTAHPKSTVAVQEELPLSDEVYIEQLLEILKEQELALGVNEEHQIDEHSPHKAAYELVEHIIEFDVQPERAADVAPDFAPNDMRTGKILSFSNAESLEKFMDERPEKSFYVDLMGVNTNEVSPHIIAHKERLIVLELNSFIDAHLVDEIQAVFTQN